MASSVQFSGDVPHRFTKRLRLADALHQSGQETIARARFQEAEQILTVNPEFGYLLFQNGYQYCELLLAEAEREAWQKTHDILSRRSKLAKTDRGDSSCQEVINAITNAEARAKSTLSIAEHSHTLLSIGLGHLTIGLANIYRQILLSTRRERFRAAREADQIALALDRLRIAGAIDQIPQGLLARAWVRALEGDFSASVVDLEEAWQIAERGGMRLYQVDIHLSRVRLFFHTTAYPWHSSAADLFAARKLIAETGYHRRDKELADAEIALKL